MPGGGGRSRGARAVDLAFALAGLALVLLAAALGRDWADRHILPNWALPRASQLAILNALRVTGAAIGLAIILLVRPRIVRAVEAGRGRALAFGSIQALVAVVAAFGATEGILRTRSWSATLENWGLREPLRLRDARTGWILKPGHEGTVRLGGRTVYYATNALGYRARSVADPIDLRRPTIVFAGESIVLGYGLQWAETVPAQVQAMTGVQTANIAVNAYATDQAYLRLTTELPRFAAPRAVIIPFLPILLDRNLDRDRPHLDETLRWHPAMPPSLRLVELARRVLRYRSTASVDRGVAMTRAVLRATIALARSRHARAIILVPQFLPEDPIERKLRTRVLDDAGLPYLLVGLDSRWRLKGDRHPDPRGARAMAQAIAAALARPAP